MTLFFFLVKMAYNKEVIYNLFIWKTVWSILRLKKIICMRFCQQVLSAVMITKDISSIHTELYDREMHEASSQAFHI